MWAHFSVASVDLFLSLSVFSILFSSLSLFFYSLSLNQFYRTPNALKFYLVIKIKQLKMTFFCVCVWSIWSFFRSWFSFSFRHITCLFFSIFNVLPSFFHRNLFVSFLLDKRTLMCLRLLHEFGVNFDFDFLRMVSVDYVCCWLLFRWGRIKEVFFSSNTVIFFRLGMWCEQEFQNDRANFQ